MKAVFINEASACIAKMSILTDITRGVQSETDFFTRVRRLAEEPALEGSFERRVRVIVREFARDLIAACDEADLREGLR